MGLFNRKKSPQPTGVTPPPPALGAPMTAGADDFDSVVRSLIREFTPPGSEITEVGNDTLDTACSEVYLGNLRGGWHQRIPGEREIWLREAVRGLLGKAARDTAQLDLSMLRPGIRTEWMARLPNLMATAHDPAKVDGSGMVARRPMADGLVRILVWDTPTTMSLINEAQLAEWGTSFDELWPVAVANLEADPSNGGWACANGMVWISLNEDDYSAERIFVDGHVDSVPIETMVMFHPTRSRLILADLMNPESLVIAATIALQEAQSPNPVSLVPIVRHAGHWYPLELEPGHPAEALVQRLRVIENTNTYVTQQELLRKILLRDDIFVATYTPAEIEGRSASLCSWTQGADSLLPKTDVISFVTADEQVKLVPWGEAERVVGARLEPTDHYPARYRVLSFPSPEELAAMTELGAPRP